MIWLRHELWENTDGLSYRLASKAETDRLSAVYPDGHLRNVFYAPSPAAAEAQYCALRGIGPYMVNPTDSEEPFTMTQLESQLADFPDDERLARQPALPHPVETAAGHHAPVVVHAPDPVDAHGEAHDTALDAPVQEDGHTPAAQEHGAHDHGAHGHGANDHGVPPQEAHDDGAHDDGAHDDEAPGEPVAADIHAVTHAAADHAATDGHAPADPPEAEPVSHPVENPSSEPAQASSAEIDALGPIIPVAADVPLTRKKPRRPNVFLGFLSLLARLVMLLIVLGAVIVGVGLATGTLDAPTLVSQARALPMQIRDHSMVRSLLP